MASRHLPTTILGGQSQKIPLDGVGHGFIHNEGTTTVKISTFEDPSRNGVPLKPGQTYVYPFQITPYEGTDYAHVVDGQGDMNLTLDFFSVEHEITTSNK